MPRKKKEEAIIIDEPVKDMRSSVISFGDLVIELHYDRKASLLNGVVTDKGEVKMFSAEVK